MQKKKGEASSTPSIISLDNAISTIVKDTDIFLTRIHDTFPEYTLHDTTHSVKIVELMDKIIPTETLESLSAVELSILILSAYLHDIGMVKSREETKSILKSNEFNESREQNPEISSLVENALKVGDSRAAIELEDALITEFIRKRHCKRAQEYIMENYSQLMEYCGVNFAEDVAQVCASHCLDALDLAERKKSGDTLIDIFRRDKMIHDQPVNVQFLSICLRLADIMDFDRERTPKTLFKYISPKSKVSLNEWIKHLSITGWRIEGNEIRYEAECTHPVYQHVLYKFIDQIDTELERCNYLLKDNKEEIARKYRLDIPIRVNRNFIESKGFYYGPFQFTLDFDKIFMLLMGEQLWETKNVAIRELLQNAIDACRHRRAFERMNDRIGYEPEIKFTHRTEDDLNILEVEDNGIGMGINIIQNYFMKVGVSYYRSKEFDKERMEFKKRGFDFDPISRFGIGILSCFMIADKVVIETYRAKSSPTEEGQPLEIEIEGPSQFFVVRDGKKDIYGTKITLFLKKDQEIDLLKILQEYAKHVEFPISVKTGQISKPIELKDEGFKIEPISRSGLEGKISEIQIDLSKNNKFKGIKGNLSLYFLKDGEGKLCFSTDEIMISENEFRKRIDERKMILDVFSQFIPHDAKERILKFFSNKYGRKIKIDEVLPKDFMQILDHYYDMFELESWEVEERRYPRFMELLRRNVREYIDRYAKIIDLEDGQFSCDGISVNLPWRYLELEIPHKYDINVIGDDKPNLTVTRGRVAEDKELRIFRNKIKTIIADSLYEQFINKKISDIPEQRHAFITRLGGKNIPIFKELLKKDIFRKEMLVVRVQKDSKEFYCSLPDMVKDFSGKIYLLDARYLLGLPKSLENKVLIKEDNFLIDVIANSSELTFFTNEKHEPYFELLLKNIEDIQYDKRFTFAKYSGIYEEMLFCRNRLKAINLNHTISKMYFRFKERSQMSNKEIIDLFERLFKEITDLWKMTDEDFSKIDNMVKEIKRKASSLDYVSSEDLNRITISKNDFRI
ncbi:MAG: ATP-binding protein [archaeon]|nr:ATP-binding protein [archaeon]